MLKRSFALLLLSVISPAAVIAGDMEITPFRMINQSPLVHSFGIPADSGTAVSPAGRTRISLTQDLASNYTVNSNSRENIMLDGESWRWTLAASYGIGNRAEVGMELPYLLAGGGFLDSFIVDWHKAFGLPQGGRDSAPRNRLSYSYSRDGLQKLDMGRSGSGIGDVSLNAGMLLYEQHDSRVHDAIVLRTALKLPTGDSGELRGSGSTDFSVALCGSMNSFTEWGTLGVFGSIGGVALTKGKILADLQKPFVAFGTAGIGWGPAEWISFKFQLNANTAVYRSSSLKELSANSMMLIMGGALRFTGGYRLDIGVSEDIAVATSPDVVFHLGLSRQF
jgi:hypothetical protein